MADICDFRIVRVPVRNGAIRISDKGQKTCDPDIKKCVSDKRKKQMNSSYTFGFIGLGLIGGSIAKALRKVYTDCRILLFTRSGSTYSMAIADGVADEKLDLHDDRWAGCDYIFLCAPVETNNALLSDIAPQIGPGTIITDVGSVKGPILDEVISLSLEEHFIGGHPMAGSERYGYANSNPAILENAYYILAPTDKVPTERVYELREIVESIGTIPLILDARLHDYVTGAISHLPHVISAALVNLVHDEDNADGIMKLVAAGGFKDITRISSSSPDIWQQICLTNKENILTLLDHYMSSLETIRDEISRTEEKRIHEFFEKARAYRESFTNSNAGPIKTEYVITVDIADKPGAIATIASILSEESINIKNIGINHNREFQQGALRIEFYRKEDTEAAIRIMIDNGYVIHSKDNA